MACAVCNHTMALVNNGTPLAWHCPRCGTLKIDGAVPEHKEPWVIQRAYQLCEAVLDYIAGECSLDRLEHEQVCVRECCENPAEDEHATG